MSSGRGPYESKFASRLLVTMDRLTEEEASAATELEVFIETMMGTLSPSERERAQLLEMVDRAHAIDDGEPEPSEDEAWEARIRQRRRELEHPIADWIREVERPVEPLCEFVDIALVVTDAFFLRIVRAGKATPEEWQRVINIGRVARGLPLLPRVPESAGGFGPSGSREGRDPREAAKRKA